MVIILVAEQKKSFHYEATPRPGIFIFVFSVAYRSPFASLADFHFLKELYFFSHLPPMVFQEPIFFTYLHGESRIVEFGFEFEFELDFELDFTRTLPLRAVCFVFTFFFQ